MPYFCDKLIRKNKQDYTDALYCALGRVENLPFIQRCSFKSIVCSYFFPNCHRELEMPGQKLDIFKHKLAFK